MIDLPTKASISTIQANVKRTRMGFGSSNIEKNYENITMQAEVEALRNDLLSNDKVIHWCLHPNPREFSFHGFPKSFVKYT